MRGRRYAGSSWRCWERCCWPLWRPGALNYALRLMTAEQAEVIGVVDSDYQIDPGFLRRCAPAFADPWMVRAGTTGLPRLGRSPVLPTAVLLLQILLRGLPVRYPALSREVVAFPVTPSCGPATASSPEMRNLLPSAGQQILRGKNP